MFYYDIDHYYLKSMVSNSLKAIYFDKKIVYNDNSNLLSQCYQSRQCKQSIYPHKIKCTPYGLPDYE